jgi:hypothetical protein
MDYYCIVDVMGKRGGFLEGQSLAPTQVGGIPPTWVGGTTQKLTCVLVMCIAHDQLNSPLTPLLSLSIYSKTFRFLSLSLSLSLLTPLPVSLSIGPNASIGHNPLHSHSLLSTDLFSPPIPTPYDSRHSLFLLSIDSKPCSLFVGPQPSFLCRFQSSFLRRFQSLT